MELRELTAFVAAVEEGGVSAASRRLNISQPALSQTVSSLERQLGVKLLERSSTGVRTTEAGAALLAEARAILARHDQALRRMAEFTTEGGGVLRLGVPMELPPDLLQGALEKFAANCPDTRVMPRHLSTAAQISGLRSREIDVGLLRERPAPEEFDAMLVARENLGVLLASELAAGLVGSQGIRLEALAGLQWLCFPRSNSPAWHDEITAILRSHGVDLGPPPPEDQQLIAQVKLAAVTAGGSFALAPANWPHQIPESVIWSPLVGHPLVRRTWVVWPANSRRRDIGQLVTAFDVPAAE
ncbi:LysR family transcriptional regulator [Mycobacterium sp. 1165178.9]|uniref:LysR substrate-binding domain-containing protein n=1 Tax=Mycobacterium sp. 1165178.9 TaxID=1834070 RepID=UPI0007FD6F88|nr:LysR family transcriptional regulator [Mycobacterium sp. 1165178.9]OBK99098.1 LysR family transcriptional regulator [Mycobacterium sp. 1165178.9]